MSVIIIQTQRDKVLVRLLETQPPRIGDTIQIMNSDGGLWRVSDVQWCINAPTRDGELMAIVVVVAPLSNRPEE